MNCGKCPHQAEIANALAPCQDCGMRNGGACENCQHLKEIEKAMRPCVECEAGKLHGQVSTDAGEAAAKALQHALPNDHCPSAGVTNLTPDVEDALRKMLFVLFDFTPTQLLLIQHVAHGRSLATFRKTLTELNHMLSVKYDLSEDSQSFRSLAHRWKNTIVAKFPQIAPFFAAVIDANAGRCRR